MNKQKLLTLYEEKNSMQNSKINTWLEKFNNVFTAQKEKSAGYEGSMIGITMADHSRHRRGKDQDRGDHLERCGDPETRKLRRNMKTRFRLSLRMRQRRQRSQLIYAFATLRISNALFLNVLQFLHRVSRGKKKKY